MAVKYISELSSVTSINDTDYLVIDDGDHNYKITWAALKALLGTVSGISADNETGTITITTTNGQTFTITPHDPTKQGTLTFDSAPTENSANPVRSGGIFTALESKLNSNDYTEFRGATSSDTGERGIVPAPAGVNQYLGSGGAWETPDSAPTAGSQKLITSGAVKTALENHKVDVDQELNLTSENPVQNKVVTVEMNKKAPAADVKAGTEAQKDYHMGFYIDADGDLCQA